MTTADDPVTENENLEPRVASAWRIRVLRGPAPNTDQGRAAKLDLSQRELVVGSAEHCGLRLDDCRVSRRHLVLRLTPFGIAIRDLGSTNGTYCRGLRVSELMISQMTIVRVGRTELQILPAQVSGVVLAPQRFGGLVGAAEPMRSAIAALRRCAEVRSPLLLQGESGVGKERAARAVASESGDLPFVIVDLAGWDGSADLEAVSRPGTLYLDQLASASAEAQAALVALFERRELPLPRALRVIAASHVDLAELVAAGQFREDLFYHLAGTRITLPPLRDRPEDVSVVAFDLLAELGSADLELSAQVVDALTAHAWPGNVRELRKTLERLVERFRGEPRPASEAVLAFIWSELQGSEPQVLPSQLPPPTPGSPLPPLKDAKQALVNAWEHRYLEELLKRYATLSAAARAAGITRVHLYRLLKRHGMDGGGEEQT
ncbi:MAG: sigma 54-interacting transcriptional regulator [Polyangiaceae bacterium]